MSSIVNQDQELLEQARKAPLKDVDAPLRDQIPQKLAKKLRDKNIGEMVAKIWSTGNANRSEWLKRQQDYLQDWDEFLVSTAEGPFQGSSSLHIPMPLIVAKALHARFLQALLGIDPYFTVKSRTEASIDRAAMVQDLMSYTLKDWVNYRRGCEESVDAWLWDWITTGCGILKARWAVEYERFVDVRTVRKQRVRHVVDENNQERAISEPYLEEEEVELTKTCFEGPLFEDIRNEDLLIIGGKGDPQAADSVHHRQRLTASELWTLVDRKVFDEDAVKAVIDGGEDSEINTIGAEIKHQRKMNAGSSEVETESDLARYEIIESYLKIDVDGSGINSNVVVWTHPRSRELLRATYLRRINKAGERPFFKIDFHRRTDQDYGIGIIEMLHPLSIEMDAIHNMRIDFGILSTMPFGFYRPTSSIDPQVLQLEPGALIPVDNPQTDIYFPNLGNRTAFGMNEEAAIQTMIERLTGINDLSLGTLTGAQGATRTATGTRALLGESNANLDVYLRRLNKGWKQALEYLLHMLQQRIPKGLSFRVTGDHGKDYWAQVKESDEIAGDFDFEISPNSSNSNKQIQQEIAAQIVQTTGNPLDIQLGVITPGNRYEALKNYYKSLGIKDYAKYLQPPPDHQYIPTPEAEVDRLLRGIDVPVLPQGDHEGYLAYFKEIVDNDEILGQFSEEQTIKLGLQAQQHEKMIQALQAQQAQAANMQQMRQNASMSQNQAPPGMSAMEGSGPATGAAVG